MKEFKIVLLVFTTFFVLYSLISSFIVLGDKLLFFNSRIGYWLALTYKWSILIALLLLIVDLVVFKIKKRV